MRAYSIRSLVLMALFTGSTAFCHTWFEPFPAGKQQQVKIDTLTLYSTDHQTLSADRMTLGAPMSNAYDLVLQPGNPGGTSSARFILQPGSNAVYLELDKQYNALYLGTVSLPLSDVNVVAIASGTGAELTLEGVEGYRSDNGVRLEDHGFVEAVLKLTSSQSLGFYPRSTAMAVSVGNEYRFTSARDALTPTGSEVFRWAETSLASDR